MPPYISEAPSPHWVTREAATYAVQALKLRIPESVHTDAKAYLRAARRAAEWIRSRTRE